MSKSEISLEFVKAQSEFWGVVPRTIQRWIKRGLPVTDSEKMARSILSMKNKSDSARKKAEDILNGKQTTKENSKKSEEQVSGSVAAAPDYDEFQDWQKERKESGQHNSLGVLEVARDYYQFKLERANAANVFSDMKNYSELVIRYEKAITDTKLAAQKLGLETGETMSKSEALKLARGLGFWLMRCVDATLKEVCPKLVGRSFPEEIYPELDAFLLDVRFLKPLSRAMSQESGVTLPGFFVQALRDQADYYLQDGGKAFEEELQSATS